MIESCEFVVKVLCCTSSAKENFGGRKFNDYSQGGTAVTTWQTTNQKDFYQQRIEQLLSWYEKCLSWGTDYTWKYRKSTADKFDTIKQVRQHNSIYCRTCSVTDDYMFRPLRWSSSGLPSRGYNITGAVHIYGIPVVFTLKINLMFVWPCVIDTII